MSIDVLSGSRVTLATHHLNTPILHMHDDRASSCDKRTFICRVFLLLLTVWKANVAINILPDDVLLLIFLFDRVDGLKDADRLNLSWRWHRLVHVCQRWRSVVFASPNFLHVRLVCGPASDRRTALLDIWPPLPIILRNIDSLPVQTIPKIRDFGHVAIVHSNRICEIDLHLTRSQLRRLASAMQKPFPALTDLALYSREYDSRLARALPDDFLGGSAPRLRSLKLDSILFPALPNLLLSTTDLVRLTLWNIPPEYTLFEAIVTSLTDLAKLKYLTIKFGYPLSLPDSKSRLPPPPTRTILPALTLLKFEGSSECLEDLVAWIEAPLLDTIIITFFHEFIYDIPQLARFMRHTIMFEALNEAREAHVDITFNYVHVGAFSPIDGKFRFRISCEHFDWENSDLRLSSLAPVFTSFLPSIYTVKHLYIHGSRYLPSLLQRNTESMEWLEFFKPFSAVKKLYIIEEFAQCIALALQELVAERETKLLPALDGIFLEEILPSKSGHVKEAIGQFVAARQLLGRPVVLSPWNRRSSVHFVDYRP